jgi:hypothetical protein
MEKTTMMGIAQNVKSSVVPCTLEALYVAMDSPMTAQICADIAKAVEMTERGEMTPEAFETLKRDKKALLPVLTPHATFSDGKRSNKTALPSGLSMYDIDHIPDPRGYFNTLVRDRCAQLGIVMAYVTPSTRGLRLIFEVPQGMTLAEAQRWMSEQLGDNDYDGSVKDMARCSFIVPRAYLLYIDEEELCRKRETKTAEKVESSEPSVSSVSSDYSDYSESSEKSSSERNLRIFDLCLKEAGLTIGDIDQVGVYNWHNSLVSILSVGICRLMTEDELRAVLAIRMPNYAREQDCRRLVSDFYKDYTKMNAPMNQRLREIFAESVTGEQNKHLTPEELLGEESPQLPRRLPKSVRLLTSKEPDLYKPAVVMGIFPALGAHLTDVHFPYADHTLHEATFMTCCMAPMSSGKSCINRVSDPIMADIKERDDENRRREDEWKEECRSMGANKQKPKRPDDLTIQIMSSDLTNAALVQKLQDARGHFLYTQVDEVELFEQLKVNGKSGQIGKIFRLAYDCGFYGQERVGIQSVSGRPQMRWNWNASTTIQRGQRFFQPMLADGTLSRISFSTIRTSRGMPMPVHGIYDEKFAEELKPYIDRLNAAQGTIDLPQAQRLIRQLDKEAKDMAWLADDETYEKLSYRAVVSAWLRAMTLYLAEGKWSKEIENLALWSFHYDMWCKMHFFGQQMSAQMAGEVVQAKGPKNMLDMLPDDFTKEEAHHIRIKQGKQGKPYAMLGMWEKRGYIVRDSEGVYHKTPQYLKRKRVA